MTHKPEASVWRLSDFSLMPVIHLFNSFACGGRECLSRVGKPRSTTLLSSGRIVEQAHSESATKAATLLITQYKSNAQLVLSPDGGVWFDNKATRGLRIGSLVTVGAKNNNMVLWLRKSSPHCFFLLFFFKVWMTQNMLSQRLSDHRLL